MIGAAKIYLIIMFVGATATGEHHGRLKVEATSLDGCHLAASQITDAAQATTGAMLKVVAYCVTENQR